MKHSIRKKLLEGLLTEKDLRRKIINNKNFIDMGVTEEMANWAHSINSKQSIWIVDSALRRYKSEMEGRNDKTPINDWIGNQTLRNVYEKLFEAQKDPNTPPVNVRDYSYESALELVNKYSHIQGWVNDENADFVDLTSVSWDEAFEMANRWYEGIVPQDTPNYEIDKNSEIVPGSKAMGNGFYWALTKNFQNLECKESMGHCGTADYLLPREIMREMWLFHLRKGGEEFITLDWHPRDKYVRQAKGKANTKPKKIYHKYIVWLLNNTDMKLDTPYGYSPRTNFHLGELDPDIAARIFNDTPGIMSVRDLLYWTPDENKGKLASNLIKNEEFLLGLIPHKFFDYLKMVSGSDAFSMIGTILKSPSFFKKMNRYNGFLTFTLEKLIDLVPESDKLIWDENKISIIGYDGILDMLDDEGIDLLIKKHSDPEMIAKIIDDYDDGLMSYVNGKLQYVEDDEYDDEENDIEYVDGYDEEPEGETEDEETEEQLPESYKRKLGIIKELRK